MKSKVVQWILHKVIKADSKITQGYATDGTALYEMLKYTSPMKPDLDTPEKLFNVSVETSNEDLVLRITGKNSWGRAAIIDWHEETVQAELKDKDEK